MNINAYLEKVRALHASGQTTEHSFRPALTKLFESIDPSLTIINEPKHITDVGAPDFVFLRREVAIGWCETKDIDKDIRNFAPTDCGKAQKDRYRRALPNLIYTNGLMFEFIREGKSEDVITIADLLPGLPARTQTFAILENRLRDFATTAPQSITSSKRLAEMMAGKAAIIKDIMNRALTADLKSRCEGCAATDLIGQYESLKQNLIRDLAVEDFADIYAETIAYGLFAARLHDKSPDTFTRGEALKLLPKSNPFLRALLAYIAGHDLDDRLRRVIDDLCSVFCATDVEQVLRPFGKFKARRDPFLHFYEVFLAEYNPTKRKARGVWYTPEPIVSFIVRAVDDVLKTEFGLANGLADTSRISIDWDTGKTDTTGKPVTLTKQVHRVQILDPATGTGTFLAEVAKIIAGQVESGAPRLWSDYVENDLIPRIYGFELQMASYAMCHMKLGMVLTGLGYKPSANPPRLGVYLTNSLEEGERMQQTLFGLSRAIAVEARAASDIKRQTPIMCVIGNPPYSGHSSNRGQWIRGLMNDYKVSQELKRPAQAKWLSDDYVKFIRFAEHLIAKNGLGVLGFVTNHGYLDNPTFLDMRKHLRQTFDRIHVLDLHGNSKKKEVCPDGSPDKNVFDIQQGVAIILAVKLRENGGVKKKLARVFHGDLWGDRDGKYERLWARTIGELAALDVSCDAPPWLFAPVDRELEATYRLGFSVADLFSPNGRPAPGVITTHDEFAISWTATEAAQKVERLLSTADEAEARKLFRLCSQNQWKYDSAKAALSNGKWRHAVTPIVYRPFDTRFTVYDPHVAVHRRERAMNHFIHRQNLGLMTSHQAIQGNAGFSHAVAVCQIIDARAIFSNKGISQMFPLYLYPDDFGRDQAIRINFDHTIYDRIRKAAGLNRLRGTEIKTSCTVPAADCRLPTADARPDEIMVFDYIYGILHCPAYRETYGEFLKTDFPRIPFPPSPEVFKTVSELGEVLRRLHLMEDAAIGDTPYPFRGEGINVVDRPHFESESGKVWINASQFFESLPATAWEFFVGGYQPAQKWLKDRKGRFLAWNDICHYQRIIKILSETGRIMRQIELA